MNNTRRVEDVITIEISWYRLFALNILAKCPWEECMTVTILHKGSPNCSGSGLNASPRMVKEASKIKQARAQLASDIVNELERGPGRWNQIRVVANDEDDIDDEEVRPATSRRPSLCMCVRLSCAVVLACAAVGVAVI